MSNRPAGRAILVTNDNAEQVISQTVLSDERVVLDRLASRKWKLPPIGILPEMQRAVHAEHQKQEALRSKETNGWLLWKKPVTQVERFQKFRHFRVDGPTEGESPLSVSGSVKGSVLRGSEIHRRRTVLPMAQSMIWHFEPIRGENGRIDPTQDPIITLEPHYFWGGLPIAIDSTSNPHKLIVGMAGSGKTLTFQVLMSSQLPLPNGSNALVRHDNIKHAARQEVCQAVVYDAKSEQIPILAGHGFEPGDNLFILNPFDKRCVAWDMAKDVTTPSQADSFAELFVPKGSLQQSQGEHRFFSKTSRTLIAAVVKVFQQKARDANVEPTWNLRDVLEAFSSMKVLRHLLKQHPIGKRVLGATLNVNFETASNIFASVRAELDEFETIAALWEKAKRDGERDGVSRSVSIEKWVTEGQNTILLLPYGPQNQAVIPRLNQFLFKRLSELLLDPKYKTDGRKRHIFIDELPTTGKLFGLEQLLAEGRSFGIEVAIGVQAISQLRTIYGEQETNTIVQMCGFTAILRSSGDTAEWAEKRIGQQLITYQKTSTTFSTSTSTSDGTSGSHTRAHDSRQNTSTDGWSQGSQSTTSNSTTTSNEERFQPTLMASEIAGLEDIKSSERVGGYFITPHLPIYKSSLPLNTMLSHVNPLGDSNPQEPFTPEDEAFYPWEESDYVRLGLIPYEDNEEADMPEQATELRPPRRLYTDPPTLD